MKMTMYFIHAFSAMFVWFATFAFVLNYISDLINYRGLWNLLFLPVVFVVMVAPYGLFCKHMAEFYE